MDAGKGILAGGCLVHRQRSHEGIIAQSVLVRRCIRCLRSNRLVVERVIGERLGRTCQCLHADVKRGKACTELQSNGIEQVVGASEDQIDAVIVEPLVVLLCKSLDESEVRLVVLAHVVQSFLVLGIDTCTYPCLGSHLLYDVSKGASGT